MYIFAKPVTPEDIDEVQSASKASIEAFEREVMGLNKVVEEPEPVVESQEDVAAEDEEIEVTEAPKSEEVQSDAAWEEVRQAVEEAMEDDEDGVGIVREAIEDALEQSGLMRARSSEEARDYVDALLTAITGTELPKATESPEDVSEEVTGEDGEAVASETAAETSPDADAEQSHDAQPAEEASHEAAVAADSQENNADVISDSETGVSVDETASQDSATVSSVEDMEKTEINEETASQEQEEKDDEADEADEDDVAESKEDSANASDMSPLKDLIVRMAQRMDGASASREDTDDALNDKSKLKAFERILGEMISRARVIESDKLGSTAGQESTESQSDTATTTAAEVDGEAKAGASDGTDSKASGVAENNKDAAEQPEEEAEQGEILGMVLTIKNKVNGQYVARPERLSKEDDWVVEYNIEELPDARARRFYEQCKNRRQKEFEDVGDRDSEWYKMFRGKLETHTAKGRAWRAREEERGPLHPVHVVDSKDPLKWEDVFGGAPPAPALRKDPIPPDVVDDFDIDVADDDAPSVDAAGEQAAENKIEAETETETEAPAINASDIGLIDEDANVEAAEDDGIVETAGEDVIVKAADEDVTIETVESTIVETADGDVTPETVESTIVDTSDQDVTTETAEEDSIVETAEEDAAQPHSEEDGEAKKKSTSDSA